ncbi:aquaporin family protein [Nocardia abscessus]|uniref:MIP/aquaporin family protein n=1 Tax=Nocardia TaxID=1817 RepID=UPI001895B30F|nr:MULTISPECIES: MIP/aquaporin family protein [Nocardia]MBF6222280.1 aquaporin family protein [Nocardia abscessus]MDE1671109.1 aquaporin family protein [Nocardia gipuzkoensis]
MNFGSIFLSEALGTGVLVLLGVGVVANVLLTKSKGLDGGWLLINVGWGFAVLAGVYVAYKTGGHLNPAVTIGILFSGADEFAPGIAISGSATLAYLIGQFLGAFVGATIAYVAYKRHFDAETDADKKLAVFATGPAIRALRWNFATEVIGTFTLVLVILTFGHTPSGLGPAAAALLVVGIGASLGGPTGYAVNPARDLGPRLAHALLPVRKHAPAEAVLVPAGAGAPAPTASADAHATPGPKDSDWGYAWVPVLGPLVGGALAGIAAQFLF